MTLDWAALEKAVLEGARDGLTNAARVVERRAKARAPVRNIYGHSYVMRPKTRSELTTDLNFVSTKATRRSFRESQTFRQRWKGPKRVADPTSIDLAMEYLADYENDNDSPLTRQGAYEVRSGRANFGSGKDVTVGGRLRGEIFTRPAKMVGEKAEASVISPTPYAKYQEFGTRHNRAHPFLRPALEESREDIRKAVAKSVDRASRKGLGNAQLEIVVRL